jgi:hypothetical protein
VVLQIVTNVLEEPAVSIFKVDFGRVETWLRYRIQVERSSCGEQEDQPEGRGDGSILHFLLAEQGSVSSSLWSDCPVFL